MNLPNIKEIANGLFDLLYPQFCAGCQEPNNLKTQPICIYCEQKLKLTAFETLDENAFMRKFWGRIKINHATSVYYMTKGSIIQSIVHTLKYKNNKEVGIWIGQIYGKTLENNKYYKDVDYIIPIPLHIKKLRLRGYNQSTQFAIGLGQSMHKPVIDSMLIRRQNNLSQTKNSRDERLKNVYNAFRLKSPTFFENKHILIVDDIVTTGSTLESCALLFPDNVKISFVTIAIASYY